MHKYLLGYNLLTAEEKQKLLNIEAQKEATIKKRTDMLNKWTNSKDFKKLACLDNDSEEYRELFFAYWKRIEARNTNIQEYTTRHNNIVEAGTKRYIAAFKGKPTELKRAQLIHDAIEVLKRLQAEDIIFYSNALYFNGHDKIEIFTEDAYSRFFKVMLVEQQKACKHYRLKINFNGVIKDRTDEIIAELDTLTSEELQERLRSREGFKGYIEDEELLKTEQAAAKLLKPAEQTEQPEAQEPAKKKPVEEKHLITPLQKASKFYTPNSYITNNWHDILQSFYKTGIDGQMSFLPQNLEIDITGRSKGFIPVYISLNYEGDITTEGGTSIDYNRARIKGFDTNVLDAICTILETGQRDIYISAIDSLLKGGKKITKLSQTRTERILLAIRKLGGTRVRLDITEELKTAYDFSSITDRLQKGVLDAAMLEYTGLELTTYAGVSTYVIHVDKLPALYAYSKAKNEITSFDTYLLATPERAEERYISLKHALLKRITLINKRVLIENTILFSSLYAAAGLEEHQDKGNKSRERDILRGMLDYWKECKYIAGYKDYWKGKSYAGFEIEPNYIKVEHKNK